jgi:hypothetical protein
LSDEAIHKILRENLSSLSDEAIYKILRENLRTTTTVRMPFLSQVIASGPDLPGYKDSDDGGTPSTPSLEKGKPDTTQTISRDPIPRYTRGNFTYLNRPG